MGVIRRKTGSRRQTKKRKQVGRESRRKDGDEGEEAEAPMGKRVGLEMLRVVTVHQED